MLNQSKWAVIGLLLGGCLLGCQGLSLNDPLAENVSRAGSDAPMVETTGFQILATTPNVSKPVAGWASQTGYKGADTTIRKRIVSLALSQIGQSSGQSVLGKGSGWETDMAGGDGQRIRNAINTYAVWRKAPGKKTLDTVKSEMRKALGSSYQASHLNQLVDRIMQVYQNNPNVPKDDGATLQYLGIRKQCLEWAMTVGLQAGGSSVNYHQAKAVSKADVRPGMGYYRIQRPTMTHAMIIVDVRYDRNGNPDKLKVAESNWANNWSNPPGQVPWLRSIGLREVDFGYTIVRYDK